MKAPACFAGGVTKQLKLELDYAKMIVNKQEDLTWLR